VLRLILIGGILGSGAALSQSSRLAPSTTRLLPERALLLAEWTLLLAVYLACRRTHLRTAQDERLVRPT
jgi:hypothetical protein